MTVFGQGRCTVYLSAARQRKRRSALNHERTARCDCQTHQDKILEAEQYKNSHRLQRAGFALCGLNINHQVIKPQGPHRGAEPTRSRMQRQGSRTKSALRTEERGTHCGQYARARRSMLWRSGQQNREHQFSSNDACSATLRGRPAGRPSDGPRRPSTAGGWRAQPPVLLSEAASIGAGGAFKVAPCSAAVASRPSARSLARPDKLQPPLHGTSTARFAQHDSFLLPLTALESSPAIYAPDDGEQCPRWCSRFGHRLPGR